MTEVEKQGWIETRNAVVSDQVCLIERAPIPGEPVLFGRLVPRRIVGRNASPVRIACGVPGLSEEIQGAPSLTLGLGLDATGAKTHNGVVGVQRALSWEWVGVACETGCPP